MKIQNRILMCTFFLNMFSSPIQDSDLITGWVTDSNMAVDLQWDIVNWNRNPREVTRPEQIHIVCQPIEDEREDVCFAIWLL